MGYGKGEFKLCRAPPPLEVKRSCHTHACAPPCHHRLGGAGDDCEGQDMRSALHHLGDVGEERECKRRDEQLHALRHIHLRAQPLRDRHPALVLAARRQVHACAKTGRSAINHARKILLMC